MSKKTRNAKAAAVATRNRTAQLKIELAKSLSYRALEPRIAFDAAMAATVDQVAEVAPELTQASAVDLPPQIELTEAGARGLAQAIGRSVETTPGGTGAEAGTDRSIVVFIDSSVQDPSIIAAAVPAGAEIVVLESARDGLGQIASYLADRHDIDALHIVSHGSTGELMLGNAMIDAAGLGAHAADLAIIRNAMSGSGDILLYGCDVAAGAKGQAFVSALSDMTGADVAASTDDTGAEVLGGDWDLEVVAGQLDNASLGAAAWMGTLATGAPHVDLNAIDNAVSPAASGNSIAGQLGTDNPIDGFTATGSNATGTFNISTAQGSGFDGGVTILADANGVRVSLIDTDGNSDGSGGAPDQFTVQIDAAADNNSRLDGIVLSHGVAGAGAENAKDMTLTWVGADATIFDPDGQLAIVFAGGGTLPANGQTIASGAVVRTLGASVAPAVTTWSIFVPTESLRVDATAIARPDGGGTSNELFDESLTFNAVLSELGHTATYMEGGEGVSIASPDVAISDEGLITRAEVKLVVQSTGDRLIVDTGSLPVGISVDPASTASSIILIGSATPAEYATALRAIKFETVGDKPDIETVRNVEVTVTDDAARTSKIANALISVLPDNDYDGVTDAADIDDDNDGILDSTESVPITFSLLPVPAKSTTERIVLARVSHPMPRCSARRELEAYES